MLMVLKESHKIKTALFIYMTLIFSLNGITHCHSSETYIIQPCLSNNISIMRNNNHSSYEQPSVITSGIKQDLSQPSDERALLKFDISSLPKGKKITYAALNLYCIGTYKWDGKEWSMLPSLNRIINVHRITRDWMGWSFTYWDYATYPNNLWTTPGGDFLPATDIINYERPFEWNQWVVTIDVKAWYENNEENHGWLLKDSNEGNSDGLKVEYMNWFYSFGIEESPKLIVEMVDNLFILPASNNIFIFITVIIMGAIIFYRKKSLN